MNETMAYLRSIGVYFAYTPSGIVITNAAALTNEQLTGIKDFVVGKPVTLNESIVISDNALS